MQFTEEKWRTVSDSQLGWKALHGRWSNWDDIFQDVSAAKTSDAMAEAAELAGDATARRFDTAKEKGSAASAVACFMRDMLTLRRGLDMILQHSGPHTEIHNVQSAGSLHEHHASLIATMIPPIEVLIDELTERAETTQHAHPSPCTNFCRRRHKQIVHPCL